MDLVGSWVGWKSEGIRICKQFLGGNLGDLLALFFNVMEYRGDRIQVDVLAQAYKLGISITAVIIIEYILMT